MRFVAVSTKPRRFVHFYPATVVVIGVYAPDGRANFMPAVWHGGLSFDPPLFGVGVSPKRYTHELLTKAAAFSVSMHPYQQARLIQKIGSVSGRQVDKVAAFGLAPVRGRALDVPILGGAYAAYELEKTDRLTTGDHDLFIGRLRGLWENEEVFAQNAIDPKLAPSLLYYGRYRYGRPEPEVLDLEGE